MPAKAIAFARMKAALLTLVAEIPMGKVSLVGDVSFALNIPPRHVSYILSQLNMDEAARVPWHRVVPTDGKFPAATKRTARHGEQIKLLKREGIALLNSQVIANLQDNIATLDDTHCNTFWVDET